MRTSVKLLQRAFQRPSHRVFTYLNNSVSVIRTALTLLQVRCCSQNASLW